jgi:hypothetical protein
MVFLTGLDFKWLKQNGHQTIQKPNAYIEPVQFSNGSTRLDHFIIKKIVSITLYV